MKKVESQLQLLNLLFNKIQFERSGPGSSKPVNQEIAVQIGEDKKNNTYRVILSTKVVKEDEYKIEIELQGIFSFLNPNQYSEGKDQSIVRNNTVAIMMPYIRSELTLLTAQPGVQPIVMPPMNINAMMEQGDMSEK